MKNSSTQQVSDLTVNISDHVDADQLDTFDRFVCDSLFFLLFTGDEELGPGPPDV